MSSVKPDRYTIVDYPIRDMEYGSYSGKTPSTAARKALRTLLHKQPDLKNTMITDESNQYLIFTIRNLRTGNLYEYAGTRILLPKPITITKSGNRFTIKYLYRVIRAKHIIS